MAQFHTHGTPPPAKQRSSPRRPVTPAIAALIAGALISASAWAAPPDAQFSASAGGASPIRIPGEVSGVIIGDFPDSGGTDSASTTTDLTAHAKGAASSKGTAGGGRRPSTIMGRSSVPRPRLSRSPLWDPCPPNSPEGAVRCLAVAAQLRAWPGESPRVSTCSVPAREGRQRAPAPIRAARRPYR